jgi:thiol-disulfide isomerase/thioredoxin
MIVVRHVWLAGVLVLAAFAALAPFTNSIVVSRAHRAFATTTHRAPGVSSARVVRCSFDAVPSVVSLAFAGAYEPEGQKPRSRSNSLLGEPAPALPWIDVIGVKGASAKQRVRTLRRMTKGRVVFIDFWATWCKPCLESMPHGLELAHRQETDSLVVVFATLLDERNTAEKVQAFADHGYEDRHGLKFDGIIAMLDDREAYNRWQRGGIPRYAVIDQQGVVSYQGTGLVASDDAARAAEALVGGSLEVPSEVPALTTQPARVRVEVSNGERMKLADRAIEEGRLDEAQRQYRAILMSDPTQDAAHVALWEISRGQTLGKESMPYTRALRRLPETMQEHETRHFVILSDADPRWVRIQGDRLERAYEQFMRFANRMDLRPLPLAHKLVAIVFSERNDFSAFASKDRVPFAGLVAGYYSPSADRLVFYHAESDKNIAAARGVLEEKLADIEAIRRASRRASMVGRRDEAREIAEGLETRLSDFNEEERRLNLFARQQVISVTVHEAVHQLMYHTRVQVPSAHQPMWLSEGLATAFETDAPKSPFGPAREYEPRRQYFWNVLDNDRLLPLRDLLIGKKVSNAVYAQSYALVTWMCRYRRGEFRDYLRRLNALPSGRVSAERHLKIFEESFGDIDRLEKSWLRYERRLD